MRPVPDLAIVVLEGAYLGSVGTYMDMLGALNAYSRERFAKAAESELPLQAIRLRTLGTSAKVIPSAYGPTWTTDSILDDNNYDVVIIPAHAGNDSQRKDDSAVLAPWLCRQREAGAIIAACGASIHSLGDAGLLRNRAVSVAPNARRDFHGRWPGVRVIEHTSVFEDDGIFTAAAPPDDFALALLIAARIGTASFADWLRIRVTGGRQIFSLSANVDWQAIDHLTAKAKYHLQENIRLPFCLTTLAQLLGVSPRSLARRFIADEGVTPLEYLQQHRIKTAQRLLEKSDFSFSQIAAMVGYANTSFLARKFRLEVGMTPRKWRVITRSN